MVLVLLLIHTWGTPDIWAHLLRGQLIFKNGSPDAPAPFITPARDIGFYWLYRLVFYLVFNYTGVIGGTIFHALPWLGTFLVLFLFSGSVRQKLISLIVLTTGIFICLVRFQIRPEEFSFFFLSIFIWILGSWELLLQDKKKLFQVFALIFICQAIWSNFHGYFILGPAIVALKLISVLWRRPLSKKSVFLLLSLLLLCLVSCLVSPFGYRNFVWAYQQSRELGTLKDAINELGSPLSWGLFESFWTIKIFWTCWIIICLVTLASLFMMKSLLFEILLSLGGLYFSTMSNRNAPFLVIFTVPVVFLFINKISIKKSINGFGCWAKILGLLLVNLAYIFLGLCIITSKIYISLLDNSKFGFGFSETAYPENFVSYLRSQDFHGKILNNASDGGFLAFYASNPEIQYFGDSMFFNRFAARDFFDSYEPQGFYLLHRQQNFSGVLVQVVRSQELLTVLLRDQNWQMTYADPQRAFFLNLNDKRNNKVQGMAPLFYNGEDLSKPWNAMALICWSNALANADLENLYLEYLKQISTADFVPALAVKNSLLFANAKKSTKMAVLAIKMTPTMQYLEEDERFEVDELTAKAVRSMISNSRAQEFP